MKLISTKRYNELIEKERRLTNTDEGYFYLHEVISDLTGTTKIAVELLGCVLEQISWDYGDI